MYLEFYGLKDFPFRLAPDPRYLFRTEGLVEVLANLQYGIETAKGLLVITGEVGTGKTTALRSHLESQDPTCYRLTYSTRSCLRMNSTKR